MVFNSLKKFDIYNETDCDLKKEIRNMKNALNDALKYEHVKDAYFTVIIVDNATIKDINKTYRNIDRETDVISFALEDDKTESDTLYNKRGKNKHLLGDIYISIDRAKEQALEYGHSLTREICFLAVHGLLHLLGYDHMEKSDEEVMFSKQEEILNKREITKRVKD